MCIRDSYIANAKGQRVDKFMVNERGKLVRTTNFGVQLNTCLLYTSDAADERSSVDLGGRRIIKKKQMREHGSKGGQHNRIG